MKIIKLKTTNIYDNVFGSLRVTFFPISIIVLPFILPLILFKSHRLNNIVMRIQYSILILMYCLLGSILSVVFIPILYFKTVVNALFILGYQTNNQLRS